MADAVRLSTSAYPSHRFSIFTSLASTLTSLQPGLVPSVNSHKRWPSLSSYDSSSSSLGLSGYRFPPRKPPVSFKARAAVAETEQPKWWEKNAGPNMIDIHSTEEFLNALSQAGDRLVIAEFYATWCASCRALFPKLCRTAVEHPDILFLKVNFDENKPMCKSLNVRVLPYFHFYRGADGRLEAFSCSLAKFQKIKDAIELHNTARCSIVPVNGARELTLESLSTQSSTK